MARVPHRLIEGCLIAAHAIESKHVFIYIRGEYLAEYEILARALDEARAARPARRRRRSSLHRGAGAYICGEETALLESLEGRRGQPRPQPPFPAVAGPLRRADAGQQRRDDRDRAVDHRDGRRGVREDRRRELAGHARSSRSRATSSAAATTSCRLGTPLRELIYDIGGGIPDGPRAEGRHPGRLVGAGAHRRPDRRAARLRLDRREPGRCFGSGAVIVVDDRCCMVQLGAAGREVLQHESCGKCTPCREGTRWMVQILERDRGGPRGPGRPRPAARRLRPDPRQVPLPARRRGRDAGRELRRQLPRRVPGAHRRGRLPVRRLVVARAGARAGRPARAPPPQEVPRVSAPSSSRSRSTAARCRCRRAPGSSRPPQAAGIEIPVFCYEPRLGPPRRRLPDVPRRGRGDRRSRRPAAR